MQKMKTFVIHAPLRRATNQILSNLKNLVEIPQQEFSSVTAVESWL